MTINVGDTVWVNGLTTQHAGTQHPKVYYIPIKATIGYIEIRQNWGPGKRKSFRLYHVVKLKKAKTYRGLELTHISSNFGYDSHEISRSWKKVKKISDSYNKAVRSYKK